MKEFEWIDYRTPLKSDDYLVMLPSGHCQTLHFSAKHDKFNAYDQNSIEQAKRYEMHPVAWAKIPEYKGVKRRETISA